MLTCELGQMMMKFDGLNRGLVVKVEAKCTKLNFIRKALDHGFYADESRQIDRLCRC